jgi:glycosyltransferase involved in cell wall biosynthesis
MSPWFYDGYRCVLGFPHIRFSTNSVPGAQDYARWLSMDFDPASVVLNGLSPEAFDDPCPEQLSVLRRELGMPADFGDETPILVGVFRLSDEKQPLLFVDVAAEITRRVPGLQVVIAGTGPMQQQVEKAIRKNGVEQNVKLLGQRDDVLSLLRVADVMLLASRFEGTPNVILEALAAGCPPVATRVGGVTELIDSGVTGYLHDPGDREGLIESVTRLLREPALRSQMGKAGRRDASERFSRGRLVEETVALYRRVMSQRDERAAITSADN